MDSCLHILADESVKDSYLKHKTFHEGDAGLDLFCPDEIICPPHSLATPINFKIKCQMVKMIEVFKPKYISYLLVPRSSISNTPLRLSNSIGVIDSGYRGDIITKVDNLSDKEYVIKKGDRLFQIIRGDLEPFIFKVVDELSTTDRSDGGFGSTGK